MTTQMRCLTVQKVNTAGDQPDRDLVAVEEPLEIRLKFHQDGGSIEKCVSITMRTPGHDFELAVGFLFSEGILQKSEQIRVSRGSSRPGRSCNRVEVRLQPDVTIDIGRLERHFYTTSSCGVCGKASIEALQSADYPRLGSDRPIIAQEIIHQLDAKLRSAQSVFEMTGGLHAAGLFDSEGNLISLREDVGRHNAVDKLIGQQLLRGLVPLSGSILMVSGRTSFEIIQKALVAGIPLVAAVGAPSSLAVDLAREFNMTLIGFLRNHRFNIYSAAQRIFPTGQSEIFYRG